MENDYTRNALFGAGASRGTGRYQEDARTSGMDEQTLLQEQRETMNMQDEGLEQIGQAARRLKNVGMVIGDELDDQNDMLDDLHSGMDNTHRRLVRETEHVVHVTEKAKAGGMCCCIALLILAIIVVAAIPF